jgi:putative transposase
MTDMAIAALAPVVGTRAACAALGEPRARYYRRHRQSPAPEAPLTVRRPQPRALSDEERQAVLDVLHQPDHVDEAPATVYAKLLDEGTYRVLRASAEVRERRRQATHPRPRNLSWWPPPPICAGHGT